MLTSLIMAATAITSSSTLAIEGFVTFCGIWSVSHGIKQTAKASYSFKH